jgi:hypothetical protein
VIEEVLQEDPACVRARWEDGHTSILTPAAGAASVTRAKRRAKTQPPPRVPEARRTLVRGPKESVRRHPALVSLWREHQHELAHAQRLLWAADAEPEQRLAAARAYDDAFFAETVEHFRREEEILCPLYVRHAGSTCGCRELRSRPVAKLGPSALLG